MIELNKNQIIIIISIISVIAVVIGYYIFSITQNSQVSIIQQEDTKEEIILKDNTKEEVQENKIENNNTIVVHIAGAVENSGIQKLPEDSRIADAIEAAGGITSEANIDNINLAQKIADGQKIYIPSINDDEITEKPVEIIEEPKPLEAETKTSEKVNINTATQTELETLSGIGPSTAMKIIEYRKENGNFKNIEEIQNVSGLGEAKYAQIKDQITI